jgi:hypothetical protein
MLRDSHLAVTVELQSLFLYGLLLCVVTSPLGRIRSKHALYAFGLIVGPSVGCLNLSQDCVVRVGCREKAGDSSANRQEGCC